MGWSVCILDMADELDGWDGLDGSSPSWGYAIGMVLLGIAALRLNVVPRWSGLLLINGVLPLLSLVLASNLPDVSSGELIWDILYGAISVPYGLSWVLLGYVLLADSREAAR